MLLLKNTIKEYIKNVGLILRVREIAKHFLRVKVTFFFILSGKTYIALKVESPLMLSEKIVSPRMTLDL